LLATVAACSNAPTEKSAAKTGEQLAIDIEPKLRNIDSVQLLYFDDPNGDSLRYTRYYKYTNSSDSTVINPLKRGLHQSFTTEANTRECRSEGKIYAYGKGEVLKTLYFNTGEDSCGYIYLISNGAFMYMKMTPGVRSILRQQKAKAVVPTATDQVQ
jgi:hypothetical protein